jgi:hypothetical protein
MENLLGAGDDSRVLEELHYRNATTSSLEGEKA